MNTGERVNLKWTNCKEEENYHVNDLYAKESKLVLIFSFLIFILGTVGIGYLFFNNPRVIGGLYSALIIGSFLLVPVFIYAMLVKQNRLRVSAFNRHYL